MSCFRRSEFIETHTIEVRESIISFMNLIAEIIRFRFSPNDSSLLADMRIRVHSPDYATPTFSSPRKIKEADSILAPSRLKSELGESDLMEESEKVVSRKSRLVREIVGLRIAAKDSATLPDDFGPPILQSSDQTFSGRESSAVVRLKEKCRQHGNVRLVLLILKRFLLSCD